MSQKPDAPLPSPLLEAKVDSLAELMARDPLKLSEPDIERIVLELRRKRADWQAADESAAATRKARKPQAQKINLDDLDIP